MTGREKTQRRRAFEKLGHYQKMSRIYGSWWAFWRVERHGLVLCRAGHRAQGHPDGGTVLRRRLLRGLLGGSAQKKLQALIQEQFGDFSVRNGKRPSADMTHRKCALTSRFSGRSTCWTVSGRNVRLRISMRAIIAACIFPPPMCGWTMCMSEGCGHEGYETCHEMVFKGLVLRCETQTPAPSPSSSAQGRRTVRAAQRRAMRCLTDASASQQSRSRMPSPFLPSSLWS